VAIRVVLASASPRRRELLAACGVAFAVLPPRVDEAPLPGERALAYVRRAAGEKGAAVAMRCENSLVLAADTVVSLNGAILGKPRDRTTAISMLRALSGRSHDVYTAVVLTDTRSGESVSDLDATRVWFRALGAMEIERYVDSGEGSDKAGSYGIQGRAGDFVPRIVGNYSNVVGLPLPVVMDLFGRATKAMPR
jgi:nucleoside triphosphate pyrophosphatase